MNNLILNILYFAIPCWIVNMSFQFIYAIKQKIYNEKINYFINKIDNSCDFIFLDKRPFIGHGIKFTSIIPILFLSIFFNILLPVSFAFYFLLGLLVFIGDILGSIIKRRFNYKKGEFLPFIDHGDYIITVGVVFLFLGYVSLEVFIYSLLITYILHPLTCYIGYKLKIKKQPL